MYTYKCVIIDLQINTEVIGCQPHGFLSMKCHFHIFFLFLPEERCFLKPLLKSNNFVLWEEQMAWNDKYFLSISMGKSILVSRVLSTLMNSTLVGLFRSLSQAAHSCKYIPVLEICSLIRPHDVSSSLFCEVFVATHYRFWYIRGTFSVLFSRIISLYYLFLSMSFQNWKTSY